MIIFAEVAFSSMLSDEILLKKKNKNNMGVNSPGGNLAGGNLLGGNSPGGSLPGGNTPGENSPNTSQNKIFLHFM